MKQKFNNSSILSFSVSPDNKNSSIIIGHVSQSGTGLAERDYYFKTDPSSTTIQEAYRKYLAKLFQLTGSDSASLKKMLTWFTASTNNWLLHIERISN